MIQTFIRALNETIENFIQQFGYDYTAGMGESFGALLDENKIEWTIFYLEDGGQAFYENFVERFRVADELGLFTLSILHELGHLETEDEMIEEEIATSNEAHFNLFNERLATNWAGRWIEDNFEEAKKLDRKFYNLIYDFYRNMLTDEDLFDIIHK